MPASCNAPAARAEQRLANLPIWQWVERLFAAHAVHPFRTQPTFKPLRVLNLDHGPGGVACALAAQTPRDSLLVAADSPAGMGVLARHRAAERGLEERVCFARLWPHALPFEDGSFDLVVTAGGLHQWNDPERGLAEVRRVLAPHGRYAIADFRRDLPLPLWVLARAVQATTVPAALRASGEPGASIGAAFSPPEAEWFAARAKLPDLTISRGTGWLMIERAGAPTNGRP